MQDSREPIEVRVLPDRIEILSHPGADRSITIENLMQYRAVSRRYRNRRVGDFLKELHLTEGRNTGFHKILHALEVNGSSAPRFETDEDRIYFLTTLFAWRSDKATGDDDHHVRRGYAGASGIAARRDRVLAFFLRSTPRQRYSSFVTRLALQRAWQTGTLRLSSRMAV